MPKQHYTIRDWSGGINNRQDPRDIKDNQLSYVVGFSVDSLGKLKTAGGLYDHKEGADGTTDLSEYIVERTANIAGSGGYGLFYFESDQGRDPTYEISDTKHPGSSNTLTMGSQITLTGCSYNDDPTITHASSSSIIVGMLVVGSGIPIGATVSSITDATHFELSASTTGGSKSSQSLVLTPYGSISFTAKEQPEVEATYASFTTPDLSVD